MVRTALNATESGYGMSRTEFEKVSELGLTAIDNAGLTRLLRLARVLPFAAFATAGELIREKQPHSPVGYALVVLGRWHREGRYA